jgi:hypothetical protein
LTLRQLSHDPVEVRVLLIRDGLGTRGRDGDLVREPVHREVEDERDPECDAGSARASEPLPDQDEQAAERGDQDPGLHAVDPCVHRASLL